MLVFGRNFFPDFQNVFGIKPVTQLILWKNALSGQQCLDTPLLARRPTRIPTHHWGPQLNDSSVRNFYTWRSPSSHADRLIPVLLMRMFGIVAFQIDGRKKSGTVEKKENETQLQDKTT